MFSKIGEFFFFILALIASLFDPSFSQKDHHAYETEERIESIAENLDEYEDLIDYALEYTDGYSSLDSVFIYDIERNSGEKFPEISNKIDDRISVYHKNDNTYVKLEYISGTPGYSSSGVYYSEKEIYMDPSNGTECEYDEESGKYIYYFTSSTIEVYKVSDHWYFYQKAYSNDSGFSRG